MQEKIINDKIPIYEIIPDELKEIIITIHGLGGSKKEILKLPQKLLKENIGFISFDFPYHGTSKEDYQSYTVANCLNVIDQVYNYALTNYPNVKINFIGNSLGSLYLYIYLQTYRTPCKVVFKSMPLNNYQNLKKKFLKKDTNDYFEVGYGRRLSKQLISDIKSLEDSLNELTLNKNNILFINGTEDKISDIDLIRNFCKEYNYNLCEIEGAPHNFKNEYLNKANNEIFDFYKQRKIKWSNKLNLMITKSKKS